MVICATAYNKPPEVAFVIYGTSLTTVRQQHLFNAGNRTFWAKGWPVTPTPQLCELMAPGRSGAPQLNVRFAYLP